MLGTPTCSEMAGLSRKDRQARVPETREWAGERERSVDSVGTNKQGQATLWEKEPLPGLLDQKQGYVALILTHSMCKGQGEQVAVNSE